MHADKQFRKELMSLAIPFALQWLLNALVGASDALMLGRLTQESIAAVSLANQVSFVLSLFIGAIVGAIGVLVAQYYGKGDFDTVRNLLSMALRYVLVLTVIFFLLAFFLPEHLMTVFTDEQDLIAIGASYLRIVSFSYLFQGASQCYLMLMKVDGRAKVSVWISAVTVVVDMTADYFLIYGAGKLPALGANGSAYSTIAVEVIALCWCVAASYQKGRIHPNSRSLRFFSPRLEKDMLRIAFPMLASSLSWGLSIVAHSVIIGHMGTDATAAYSVTNVATSLIQCLSQGFANGAGVMLGTLLGQNLFAKWKERDCRAEGKGIWQALLDHRASLRLCKCNSAVHYRPTDLSLLCSGASRKALSDSNACIQCALHVCVLVQRNLYMRRFSGRRRCKIRCGQRIDCNVVPGASDLCFGLLCVPLAGHGRLYGHVCR